MDRARPLRGPLPGPPPRAEARLRGPLGPRAGAGPAASVLPRRPREERVSTCPQIASLLITRVITSNRSHSPALGCSPGTCARPQKRTWPLPRARAKQPHPECFGGAGEGREKKKKKNRVVRYFKRMLSGLCWTTWHCRCPTTFDPRSWLFHVVQPNGILLPSGPRVFTVNYYADAGILIFSAPRSFTEPGLSSST